jgi:hypothetical protein
VFCHHHDVKFERPDYFKLRLLKKLEVLVVTDNYYILSRRPWETEQKLKAVENKYPSFKRPRVILKDMIP